MHGSPQPLKTAAGAGRVKLLFRAVQMPERIAHDKREGALGWGLGLRLHAVHICTNKGRGVVEVSKVMWALCLAQCCTHSICACSACLHVPALSCRICSCRTSQRSTQPLLTRPQYFLPLPNSSLRGNPHKHALTWLRSQKRRQGPSLEARSPRAGP